MPSTLCSSADVVLLLDAAGTVTPEDWSLALDFSLDLFEAFLDIYESPRFVFEC
jgi:hypothetical protein